MKRTIWISPQSLADWEADRKTDFSYFGVPAGKARLGADVAAGDLLIQYAAGGFIAGARDVAEDGLVPLGREGHYQRAYPWAIRTKPAIMLPQFAWLRLDDLADRLVALSRAGEGIAGIRAGLGRLPRADGATLLTALLDQAARIRTRPFSAATAIRRTPALRQAIKRGGGDGLMTAYRAGTIAPSTFWRAVHVGGGVVPFIDWRGSVSEQYADRLQALLAPSMLAGEGEMVYG